MAAYRTLTGNFSFASVRDKYANGEEEISFNSSAISGIVTTSNGDEDNKIRATVSSGDVMSFSDFDSIDGGTVTITAKKTTTVSSNKPILNVFIRSAETTNARTLYKVLNEGNGTYWSPTQHDISIANTTESQTLAISLSTEEIRNAIQYGLRISGPNGDKITIESAAILIMVVDEYVPPEITFKAENGVMVSGTYHHDPNKAFFVGVNYTQAAGDPLQKLTVSATGMRSGTYTKTDTKDTLLLGAEEWAKLPVSGTLTITAQGSVAESNTLTIPYVIDEYDVHFTSPTSGSVIQSDEDLVISWEAVAPSTQTIDAPEKYLTEIWFDNGEGNGGDFTTLTSKTITADQLTGHNQVHMRLYSYYIMCETARSAAPVMNLYIQQAAGTGNVTVVDASQKPHIIIVSWESTGQTAYQVRVGDFTSEILWGAKTQYNVPLALKIGVTYPIQVRIQDTQGNWMDWTERIYFTPTSPLYENLEGVTATVTDGGVKITVDRPTEITESVYAKYSDAVIYRNGEPIAVLPIAEQIEYVDRAANGETVYSVAITRFFENGQFGLAAYFAPVTVDATPDTDGLVLADKTWLPLRYTVDEVQYGGSASEEVYQRYYSGRQYPVVMRSGRKTETLSLAYADPTGALADILSEQVGTVVLFKNLDGLRFWGCLESVSPTRHRGWCAVSLTLRKVDVNEWVPLVWGMEE